MNSCDNLWMRNVSHEAFRGNNGIFLLDGTQVPDVTTLPPDATVNIANNTNLEFHFELKAGSVWVLENCNIRGNVTTDGDFVNKNNLRFNGIIRANNAYFGHNFKLDGSIVAHETCEIGNNAEINGNIDCRILRIGENSKVNGYIRAEKVFAGSQFLSNGEVTAVEFMTGENSKLLGENNIRFFYSQNGITMNGGNFTELHTDDNFKSLRSLRGFKLIMDNCAIIEGDITAEDYIRVGDRSVIKGNLHCGRYFEFGPGTQILGRKQVVSERALPPSSMKIRENGKVYFP